MIMSRVAAFVLWLAVPCKSLALTSRALPLLRTAAPRTSSPSCLFGGGGGEGEGGGGMGNMMETSEYPLRVHSRGERCSPACLLCVAVKKAQQVGVKVKELQEELQETEIEAIAADGGATVVISGAQVPLSVEVTPELLAKGAAAVSEAGSRTPPSLRCLRSASVASAAAC